jgi:hypothetical protein
MPNERKAFYIASEIAESEDPCRLDTMKIGFG